MVFYIIYAAQGVQALQVDPVLQKFGALLRENEGRHTTYSHLVQAQKAVVLYKKERVLDFDAILPLLPKDEDKRLKEMQAWSALLPQGNIHHLKILTGTYLDISAIMTALLNKDSKIKELSLMFSSDPLYSAIFLAIARHSNVMQVNLRVERRAEAEA